jgi:hypothetical protein
MAYVIVFVLLLGVVLLVSQPFRQRWEGGSVAADPEAEQRSGQRTELEAARDAKYREIRDAELDHQTGKLSDQDFRATDSTLRAEAIELLRQLDALDDAADGEAGTAADDD